MATKDPTTPTSRYQPYPASSTRKRKNPKSDFVATLYTVFKLEGKEDKFGWHDDVTIYINDPRALIREINSHGFSLGKEYSLYRSLNDYSFRRHAKYDRRKPHNRQGASDDGSQGLIYTHTQGYFNRKCPELLSHIKRKSALSNRRYKGRAGSTNARNQQQQHQESLVSSEPNSCETSELSLSSPLLETIIANLCYTGTPANVQPGFIPLSAQSANDQLLPLSTGQLVNSNAWNRALAASAPAPTAPLGQGLAAPTIQDRQLITGSSQHLGWSNDDSGGGGGSNGCSLSNNKRDAGPDHNTNVVVPPWSWEQLSWLCLPTVPDAVTGSDSGTTAAHGNSEYCTQGLADSINRLLAPSSCSASSGHSLLMPPGAAASTDPTNLQLPIDCTPGRHHYDNIDASIVAAYADLCNALVGESPRDQHD